MREVDQMISQYFMAFMIQCVGKNILGFSENKERGGQSIGTE